MGVLDPMPERVARYWSWAAVVLVVVVLCAALYAHTAADVDTNRHIAAAHASVLRARLLELLSALAAPERADHQSSSLPAAVDGFDKTLQSLGADVYRGSAAVSLESLSSDWQRLRPAIMGLIEQSNGSLAPSAVTEAQADENALARLEAVRAVTQMARQWDALDEWLMAAVSGSSLRPGLFLIAGVALGLVLLAWFALRPHLSRLSLWRGARGRALHVLGADERGEVAALGVQADDEPGEAGAVTTMGRTRLPGDVVKQILGALLEEPDAREPFRSLLVEIEVLVGAMVSAIVVPVDSAPKLVVLAATSVKAGNRLLGELSERLAGTAGQARDAIVETLDPNDHCARLVALQLFGGDQCHGWLLLRLPVRQSTENQSDGLLEAVGEEVSHILSSVQRARLNRRVALCEERAAIARELHDSLAQSLSYLKIQTSRLQRLLGEHAQPTEMGRAEIDAIVAEFRGNLNLAYRQLRELITTCRLTMDGKAFGQALEESVDEFARRSAIVFDLDNRLAGESFTADQELQVLHIIRESLSNIVRHSQAHNARVSLDNASDGKIVVRVADDGVGLERPNRHQQHYGLIIMQERAHSLGGEMRLEDRHEGGTEIVVTFPSEALRNASAPTL